MAGSTNDERATIVEVNALSSISAESDDPRDMSSGSDLTTSCKCPEMTGNHSDGILKREARRMANNPCIYFWIILLVSIALSLVAIIKGGLSIEASSKGWTTRGTEIANRQAASLVVRMNRKYLSTGGDDAWKDLTNNIQPSWENVGAKDSFNSNRRAMQQSYQNVPYRQLMTFRLSVDYEHAQTFIGWTPATTTKRILDEKMTEHFGSCALSEVYTSNVIQRVPRLWPVWKSTSNESLFGPNPLYEICVAEQATQKALSDNNLCLGCEHECLPPHSIVLFARLTIPNSFNMTCMELKEAWKPYQAGTEIKLRECVADIRASTSATSGTQHSLPASCPFGFSPHMVDLSFQEKGILQYSSSIFVTESEKLGEIYSHIKNYSRGGQHVVAAYDTQKQSFNFRFQNDALEKDMAFAFGSAVVVIAAVFVHTRSLLVTIVGVLQIGLSFPVAHVVYVFVGGYSFFPILNYIGLFVAFALGSDDIFVAVDKWKNARLDDPVATTAEIAALALPEAAKAMLLTTLTTSLAFFATAICPVAPIKLFANFVGILVMLVYVLCILLVFPVICFCDRALQRTDKALCLVRVQYPGHLAINSDTTEPQGRHSSLIRNVMQEFHRFMFKFRYVSLSFCLATLVVCIYATTKLQPPSSLDVRLLDESIEFERNYKWRQQLLHEDLWKSAGSVSHVFWGVKPVDTGDHNDPNSFTKLVLDENFDPSSPEAQLFLLNFCDDFHDQPFASKVAFNYDCPFTRLDKWLRKQSSLREEEQETIYTSVCGNTTGLPLPEKRFHGCASAWAREANEVNMVLRNDEVLILSIPFKARFGYTDRFIDLKQEFRAIETWLDKKLSLAPQSVDRAFFAGGDFWFMDTHEELTKTAYSSAGIALLSSAMVIFISSKSISLTLFSVITIFYILVATTATMVAFEWTLGFLECICIAILIGISADFVTHLSAEYASGKGKTDRKKRTERALVYMGPSILAAAFTTAASSVIMLFTVIVFFRKFALVLLCTIIHSTLGAFIFFCSLTNCLGPAEPGQFVQWMGHALLKRIPFRKCLSTESSKSKMMEKKSQQEMLVKSCDPEVLLE